MDIALGYLLAWIAGALRGVFGCFMVVQKQQKKAQRKMQKKLDEELAHKEEIFLKMEERVSLKEEKLEAKMEELLDEKSALKDEKRTLEDERKSLQSELWRIWGLTPKQAKEELMGQIEKTESKDLEDFLDKRRSIKEEEAELEASKIISKAIAKVAVKEINDMTSTSVAVPDESYKGRLIGREWRNISFFEKTTGVELLIDDTPGVVKLSSFDGEQRYKAMRTLEMLIKDGRINPNYIEKCRAEVEKWFEEEMMKKGREALAILGIPMIKPEIVVTVGRFALRYSYGQNLWVHSIEVAKICEALASEMWIDSLMAKKAGLLHDIGKVLEGNERSHTAVGADMLRKQGMADEIVNAAESHHFDVPMTSPISRLVAAADAMSASRPGARFMSKDFFVEKMSELENLIKGVHGVQKVSILQAGREIYVYVDPQEIPDTGVRDLIKNIAKQVEDHLDYPGIIRVTAMRETKIIDYLR